ncbi:ASCH domain-containing protein [Brachybacterium sp. AOP43-C2-M15]|uniref:ASCH domain-containing protein n=1 Tax=Brachybacterium sp. AOP43-C2-M15 TaxID=3457661 RepID=UPI00403452EA
MTAPDRREDAGPAGAAGPAGSSGSAGAAGGVDLADLWAEARAEHPALPAEPPEAWAFGATPEQADDLLTLVLEGTKTASAAEDYESDGEPLPVVGDLSIVLDGSGLPRAVLEVSEIEIVPFGEVTAEHARAEGEGDRSLAAWRRIHEQFWTEHSARGFSPDMPVVCERFRVLHVWSPRRP